VHIGEAQQGAVRIWHPAGTANKLAKDVVHLGATPAAAMSPIVLRMRQVIPASVARKTHFSHISRRITELARNSNLALPISAAIPSMRGERFRRVRVSGIVPKKLV
jgi:hypothetical protein